MADYSSLVAYCKELIILLQFEEQYIFEIVVF